MTKKQLELALEQAEARLVASKRHLATVYCNGKPWFVAFSHSNAFNYMRALKGAGQHSYYRAGVQ